MSSINSDFEPNSIQNISDSVSWLRKSTSYIISSILYLRNFFDENSYFQLQYETIKLRILSRKSHNPNVLKIIHYLQGSFDALEMKYLRSLTMGFFEKIQNTDANNNGNKFSNEPIELYQINFDYNKFGDDNCTDFKAQTSIILKNLLSALKLMSHPSKQKKYYVSFKLYYNDEITPSEYQPPGFIDTPDSGEFATTRNNFSLVDIGRLNTKYHSMTFQMKKINSVYNQKSNYLETFGIKRRLADNEKDQDRYGNVSDESIDSAYSFNRNGSKDFGFNKRFKKLSSIKTIQI